MNNFNSLEKAENLSIYGHSFIESEIESQYPYENKIFIKDNYNGQIITYNPLIAMQYKLENAKCLVWGQKVNDCKRAFVFNGNRNAINFSF